MIRAREMLSFAAYRGARYSTLGAVERASDCDRFAALYSLRQKQKFGHHQSLAFMEKPYVPEPASPSSVQDPCDFYKLFFLPAPPPPPQALFLLSSPRSFFLFLEEKRLWKETPGKIYLPTCTTPARWVWCTCWHRPGGPPSIYTHQLRGKWRALRNTSPPLCM